MAPEVGEPSSPITTEDLKGLETTLSSSLATQLEISQAAQLKLMQTMMSDFMEKYKPSTSSSPTPVVTPIDGTLLTGVEAKASDNNGDNSEKVDDDEVDKDKYKDDPSKSKKGTDSKSYHAEPPPSAYSPDPRIPHHHIVNQGPPPPLNPKDFERWQSKMMSYLNSSSIELWRIVRVGFKAQNPNHMTRGEVVESQYCPRNPASSSLST